jgi:3-oxoacyl-[acyl-carrier protein] reductase
MPINPPQQRVLVITGCASGIGRHLAMRAAEAGHNVLVTDIDMARLTAEAERLGWLPPHVLARELDVRDAGAWQATIDEAAQCWGSIDVLVNVAGIVRPGNVHELTPEALISQLHVNAQGMMLGTQTAARWTVRQGNGHIVNIASLAGIAPIPGLAGYTASMFAIRGFSLAVAHELAPHGVSVTCVCPDAVETPMLDLEMSHDAAALAFSARRYLAIEEVGRVIFDQVLARRPLEVVILRHRGWLAKLTSLWPASETWLLPKILRDGRKRQEIYRGRKTRVG